MLMPFHYINKIQNYDHLYLSPHPDDAALSCGGTIASRSRQGKRQLVVTLCTKVPASAASQWMQRLHEEELGMSVLGADCLMVNCHDAPFRHQAYQEQRHLFGAPQEGDAMFTETVRILASLAENNRSATLHAPLGVGLHVDHLIACSAALAAWPSDKLYLYEDIPYTVNTPDTFGVRIQAIGNRAASHVFDISGDFQKKIDAVNCYQSQVELLFDNQETALRIMRAEAGRVLPGGLGEKSWRIAG